MADDDGSKRGNINELIQELLTIIPEPFFQEYYRKNSDPKVKEEHLSRSKGASANANKPTKGQILTQAVEYVNSLQEQVDLKNREEVELILKIKELSKETGSIVNDLNLDNTSAEIALARIGVGPLAGMYEKETISNHARPSSNEDAAAAAAAAAAAHPGSSNEPSELAQPVRKEPPIYKFDYGGYREYNNEP